MWGAGKGGHKNWPQVRTIGSYSFKCLLSTTFSPSPHYHPDQRGTWNRRQIRQCHQSFFLFQTSAAGWSETWDGSECSKDDSWLL